MGLPFLCGPSWVNAYNAKMQVEADLEVTSLFLPLVLAGSCSTVLSYSLVDALPFPTSNFRRLVMGRSSSSSSPFSSSSASVRPDTRRVFRPRLRISFWKLTTSGMISSWSRCVALVAAERLARPPFSGATTDDAGEDALAGDAAPAATVFAWRVRAGVDVGVARWWLTAERLCVRAGGGLLGEGEAARENAVWRCGTTTETIAVGIPRACLGGEGGAESGDEGGVGVALCGEAFFFPSDRRLAGAEGGTRIALMIPPATGAFAALGGAS